MANVWQANYWAGGSKTYGSGSSGYDSSTGYCNLVSLGQMIAGRYGSVDNVTCLRFACNDSNYSKLHFKINNATDYTGQGTVKILVRTSALSSVTKSALENLGSATREYTCVSSSSGYGELNEFDLTYEFKKGNVYYIYIWGKGSSDTWRFRWYAPDSTYSGFAVTYTIASYTFSITGDTGVSSVTGSGTYKYGSSVTTTATAKTGYHLVSYTGQAADGTGSNTWTGCANSSTHTTTWTVNANRTIKVNSALNTYTLSYSNPTGATITVKRNGSTLSNGDTITHFDVLTISVSANTGYNITSIKVNNASFTSGNTHTVSGAVKIEVTTELKTYTLSYSNPTGATITVKRNGTSLSAGATIAHFDVLTISVVASTGYNILSINVNGSAFTSGNTHTVSGNVTVSVATSLKTYTLTISQGTGTSITIKKGSTTLSNNATITHFDELTVTITANTGYKLSSQSHTSGSTITVSGNVSVSATATVLSYALTISAGDGAKVSVNRTESPKQGASTGTLSNNATIYYSDVLSITTEALSGYRIIEQSHDNGSYTVTDAINVSATAELLGLVYIHNGTSWVAYEIYIDNGSKFERYIPHIDDGSKWDICI